MPRGKAVRRLAKLTNPRVAGSGTKNATRSVSSELLGRYRACGSGRALSSGIVG